MIVPVTSDLHGYAAFWDAWLQRFAWGGCIVSLIIIVLLVLIWRK